MERLQTGQDRSSTSKVRRLNTVPAGQRYAMVMPSYFSSLSRFNAKKPSPYHHDMQGKTILAFSRIVLIRIFVHLALLPQVFRHPALGWPSHLSRALTSQGSILTRVSRTTRLPAVALTAPQPVPASPPPAGARTGVDHSVGHSWPLSMMAEPFLLSFFPPCMIVARFPHISRVLHRWLGNHDVEFVLVHAWSFDVESRMEKRMPTAMTALAQCPFLRC